MEGSKKPNYLNLKRQKIKGKAIHYDLVSLSIFIAITIFFVFIESVYTIIKGLRTGFIRKKILSEDSDLGFDLYIKMKS